MYQKLDGLWDCFPGTSFWSTWIPIYNEFETKYPSVRTDCLLYEGILTAVKCYQRRLGSDVKENVVIGDAFVWRYLQKSSVKDIYLCLVKTSETPKYIEKWSKVPAVETDTKAVLDKSFQDYSEKCLIWFQYKLLYNLLRTGRYLFQRQLVAVSYTHLTLPTRR